MQEKKDFYNEYHKKNNKFFSIIGENNFTYFYIQKFILRVFAGLGRNPRVLDIGCGVGTLALYLANKGAEVDGYDISSRSISIARDFLNFSKIKNVEFKVGDVQKMKITKKYDLLICTEVIEHLEDDKGMILKMSDLLRKDGYLILSTPSQNAPLFRLGFLNSFDREVGHLRRYNEEILQKIIKNSHFRILEMRKIEGLPRNFLFTIRPFGELIRLIRGPFITIFHKIDEIFVSALGESNLIVLAQKK